MQTATVPAVVYGCGIWFVTLGKHWVRLFKNRVLKKILELRGRKQLEAIKLHTEELHDWYCPPITFIVTVVKSRRKRWTGIWRTRALAGNRGA